MNQNLQLQKECQDLNDLNSSIDTRTPEPTLKDDGDKIELEILCLKLKNENEFLKYTSENIEKVKEDKLDLINRCKQLETSQTELLRVQVAFETFKKENERISEFLKDNANQYGVASISDLINLLSTQRIEICELKDEIANNLANLKATAMQISSRDNNV